MHVAGLPRWLRQLDALSRARKLGTRELAMAERKEPLPMSERLPALEKELARLRKAHADMARDLEVAHGRVRELEAARDHALDRIEWAIDSLHNVLDQGQ